MVYVCTGCKKYWRVPEKTQDDVDMDSSWDSKDEKYDIKYELDQQGKGKFAKKKREKEWI